MDERQNGRACNFCQAQLHWIPGRMGGNIPCEEPPLTRTDRDKPMAKGTYFTATGTRYLEHEVPFGVQVWRSHWDRCPGATFVRAKQKKKPGPKPGFKREEA